MRQQCCGSPIWTHFCEQGIRAIASNASHVCVLCVYRTYTGEENPLATNVGDINADMHYIFRVRSAERTGYTELYTYDSSVAEGFCCGRYREPRTPVTRKYPKQAKQTWKIYIANFVVALNHVFTTRSRLRKGAEKHCCLVLFLVITSLSRPRRREAFPHVVSI